MVENDALGTTFIEELLAMVDRGEEDNTAHLMAERERLQHEVGNLLDLAASGVSAETIAPKVRERQTALGQVEHQLRVPRPERPNIDRLRDALNQRAAEWRETLRSEPEVARVLLRRLVGPLTLFDPADHKAFVEWETSVSPALIEGLAEIQVGSSPPGTTPFHDPLRLVGSQRAA